MYQTQSPLQQYFDLDGKPLDAGYVYFGQPSENPETSPITVYWDAAGTQPALQPLRTSNGYIMRSGKPASVFISSEYSITVKNRKNALVIYAASSSTFDPSGTLRLDLAASTGASLVGGAVQVVNSIAALRGIAPNSSRLMRTRGYSSDGDMGHGIYYGVTGASVGTYVDNAVTTIVPTGGDGSTAWLLAHNGAVSILQAGFVADYNGTDGTDNTAALLAMIADTNISKIIGATGQYWFAKFTGNTHLAQVTRPLIIDWQGAELFTGETDPTQAWTSTAFMRVQDTGGFVMSNYEFTDVTYASSNNSRGIQPVQISNSGTNVTYGYTLGPFTVHKGQSLVTCGSTNVGTAIAKQIRFVGACRGIDVYYGINLASNGDDFSGVYTVESPVRAFYVYGVEDVDAICHVTGTPKAASANVLIVGDGIRTTKNVYLKASFDTINGLVMVGSSNDPATDAQLENINIDLYVGAVGSNINTGSPLIVVRDENTDGTTKTSSDYSVDKLAIKFRSAVKFSTAFQVQTTSPNVTKIGFDGEYLSLTAGSNSGIHFGRPGGRVCVGGTGDISTTPVKLDMTKVFQGGVNRNFYGILRISSFTAASVGCVKEYAIMGSIGSTNLHSVTAGSAGTSVQAGAYNPTLTITAPSPFDAIYIGASAGGSSSATTTVEFTSVNDAL